MTTPRELWTKTSSGEPLYLCDANTHDLIEKLQKENEELIKENERLKEWENETIDYDYFTEHYDKYKARIEELKKENDDLKKELEPWRALKEAALEEEEEEEEEECETPIYMANGSRLPDGTRLIEKMGGGWIITHD